MMKKILMCDIEHENRQDRQKERRTEGRARPFALYILAIVYQKAHIVRNVLHNGPACREDVPISSFYFFSILSFMLYFLD